MFYDVMANLICGFLGLLLAMIQVRDRTMIERGPWERRLSVVRPARAGLRRARPRHGVLDADFWASPDAPDSGARSNTLATADGKWTGPYQVASKVGSAYPARSFRRGGCS
jgi:hypothetical protein